MRYVRRFRYWLGARLLWPHIKRLINQNEAWLKVYDHGDVKYERCQYMAIGLMQAMRRDDRQTTADSNSGG